MVIISGIGAVLLVFGLAMRLSSHSASFRGPWWRARSAFETRPAWVRFVVGTNCIVAGCILVAIVAARRILA
jgi:hypothetical protein